MGGGPRPGTPLGGPIGPSGGEANTERGSSSATTQRKCRK